jgi:lysophospholipase L1-like esterase
MGDSIAAEVDPLLIATDAVNFGIGGDTTRTLAARLPTLRSVTHGRAVVIEVGVNDLKYRPVDAIERDYDALLAQIGGRLPIVALSVLPVDEAGFAARKRRYLRNNLISELNRAIGNACKQHANCRFVDAWSAMQDRSNYGEDGWHLSYAGVHKLAAIIARALQPL